MKKLLCLLAPFTCLLFIACGGGDSTPTPPPAPLTLDQTGKQQLNDLYNSAQGAVQSCSGQYAPVFALIATQLKQSAPGQAAPVIPEQASNGGDCNNKIANLLLLFSTIRVPQGQGQPDTMYAYLPEAKQWLIQSVGKSLINAVGSSLQSQGIQMTPEITQKLLAVAIQHVNQNVKPQLSGQAQATANSVGSQFGL